MVDCLITVRNFNLRSADFVSPYHNICLCVCVVYTYSWVIPSYGQISNVYARARLYLLYLRTIDGNAWAVIHRYGVDKA